MGLGLEKIFFQERFCRRTEKKKNAPAVDTERASVKWYHDNGTSRPGALDNDDAIQTHRRLPLEFETTMQNRVLEIVRGYGSADTEHKAVVFHEFMDFTKRYLQRWVEAHRKV